MVTQTFADGLCEKDLKSRVLSFFNGDGFVLCSPVTCPKDSEGPYKPYNCHLCCYASQGYNHAKPDYDKGMWQIIAAVFILLSIILLIVILCKHCKQIVNKISMLRKWLLREKTIICTDAESALSEYGQTRNDNYDQDEEKLVERNPTILQMVDENDEQQPTDLDCQQQLLGTDGLGESDEV